MFWVREPHCAAAAGMTNGAPAGDPVQYGIVRDNGDRRIVVQAELGHEIKRPGYVRLVVSMNGDTIIRLQVGGVATKVVGAAVAQCRYAYVVTVMRGIVRKKPD